MVIFKESLLQMLRYSLFRSTIEKGKTEFMKKLHLVLLDQCTAVRQRTVWYPFVHYSALLLCIFSVFNCGNLYFFTLHFFHVVLSCVVIFSCCPFSTVHSFHVTLFSCCTLFILHFLHVVPFSCWNRTKLLSPVSECSSCRTT